MGDTTATLSEVVARFIAAPTGPHYTALLEVVEEGGWATEDLATALLQVSSALVKAQGPILPPEPGGQEPPRWREELAAVRRRWEAEVQAERAAAVDEVLRDFWARAAPAAIQLPALCERYRQGKRVSGRDWLAVADVLLEALAAVGLEPLGTPGAEVAYDPRRHVPRGPQDRSLQPGDPAIVRVVGYTLNGRVIRPAQVSQKDELAAVSRQLSG